jgi:hypothetical protein
MTGPTGDKDLLDAYVGLSWRATETFELRQEERLFMAKKKITGRVPWTKEDVRALKAHSKSRTPAAEAAKALKRTEGAVRQKAKTIGLGLGHRR